MTIETFEHYSLVIGSTGLILYMMYIIYCIGKESKAGKYGMMVLFFALGLGFVGFIVKTILVELME